MASAVGFALDILTFPPSIAITQDASSSLVALNMYVCDTPRKSPSRLGVHSLVGWLNGSPIRTDDSHERNHPAHPPLLRLLPLLFWVVVKMGYFLWRGTDERRNERTNVTFINMMANIFLSMSGGSEEAATMRSTSLPRPSHAPAPRVRSSSVRR